MNLRPKENVLTPAKGVYATRVILESGETYLAVTNVGTRPTVDDGDQLTIEGFILDFEGDLYGQRSRWNSINSCGRSGNSPPLRL